MTSVLEARGLVKRFRPTLFGPKVAALKGVSFSVEEGECFGLLGQNGAGKTTALKILTGLLEADEGEATLLGRASRDSAARRELGFLPENPYFHEHLTPNEGLALYGRLVGLTREQIESRAPALLARVGLTDAAARRLRGFSKGMRQRFGLAAALLHEPPLLLLDEPLSGLDPGGRLLVKELILEQRRAGRTVLLCSHVLADVQELCDRVVVLDHGEVVRSGTIHELLESAPRSFELCAEQVDAALRAKIEAVATLWRTSGDVITARLPGSELGPALAAEVYANGARLLSLVPERESLEEWFVRLTGGSIEGSGGERPVEPRVPGRVAEPEAVS
jgi:ABC-2 type transport system ATP-binding protein